VNFRRQHALGPYIVDFCSIKANLIIELDGSQHLEQEEYDLERSQYLKSQGYKVIRFWNNDVMNDIEGVVRVIQLVLLLLAKISEFSCLELPEILEPWFKYLRSTL
jgi:very-short-patch-repair endonuclease